MIATTVLARDCVLETGVFEHHGGTCSCGSSFFKPTIATMPPGTEGGWDCEECGLFHQELPVNED